VCSSDLQGKTGPTTYGNLTPVVANHGVPFNAQVAYQLVALGHYFLPADLAQAAPIENEFRRLRAKHHCYFEYPHSLILPQRVGGSAFVKGMNDRNHVTNAAFIGLERKLTRTEGLPGRPWYTHQVYAPGFYTGYGVKTLPAIREALEQRQWAQATQ